MHDVIIAGGGPVGLFLAGELALSGTSVLVLERDEERNAPLKALPLGLRGLNAGSAEAFYRRGLLAAVTRASGVDEKAVGAAPEAVRAPAPRTVSHFAGMTLDAADIDVAALPERLPSPAMEGFLTSLEAVGSVLSEQATTLGVEIVRGAPVTAVAQGGRTVAATAGGNEFRASRLVVQQPGKVAPAPHARACRRTGCPHPDPRTVAGRRPGTGAVVASPARSTRSRSASSAREHRWGSGRPRARRSSPCAPLGQPRSTSDSANPTARNTPGTPTTEGRS